MTRPYVTLSCAMSLDGYLDSATPPKLAMSNAADFDRVDQLRADSDAIMVGASHRPAGRSAAAGAQRRAAAAAPRRGQAELADQGDRDGERRPVAGRRVLHRRAMSRSSCTARRASARRSARRLGGVATVVGARRRR